MPRRPTNPRRILPMLGATFTPKRLSGLTRWYDATSIVGLVDADPVTTWPDRTGNADATQGTAAKKPTYKVNILNNKPVVRFDGVDDVMAFTATSGLQVSIFVVAKVTSGTDDYLIGGTDGSGAPAILTGFTAIGFEAFNVTDRQTLVASASVAFHIIGYSLNDGGGAGAFVGYADGSQVFSTTESDTLAAKGFGFIGAATALSANAAGTDVAEICIYNRILTATEWAKLFAYGNRKWRVY